MFSHLQIHDWRQRWLVGVADLLSAPLGWRRRTGSASTAPIERVLILRLERIGDLLMVLEAFRRARARWPNAEIDVAVGSWNAPIAALVPDLTRVETADVPWLARERAGLSWPALVRRAREWRNRRYDLVINFEPDIRSNFLAWLVGARRRVGYRTGGGGALLTDAASYDTAAHVATNAGRLVDRAAGFPGESSAPSLEARPLRLPAQAVARAHAALAGAARPVIGVHASGGRESKQWHPDRFARVARRLAETRGATIVLTGASPDRALVDAVKRGIGDAAVVDTCGALDLIDLAALLAELDLLVTSDTGPMHLAAAVGTPVVALFGPSDPRRYGPLAREQRVVRVDLWCSPCGQVRLPPERCRGHVPDCMDGITIDSVVQAANELLDLQRAR